MRFWHHSRLRVSRFSFTRLVIPSNARDDNPFGTSLML
jgi:hypothetical protein